MKRCIRAFLDSCIRVDCEFSFAVWACCRWSGLSVEYLTTKFVICTNKSGAKCRKSNKDFWLASKLGWSQRTSRNCPRIQRCQNLQSTHHWKHRLVLCHWEEHQVLHSFHLQQSLVVCQACWRAKTYLLGKHAKDLVWQPSYHMNCEWHILNPLNFEWHICSLVNYC